MSLFDLAKATVVCGGLAFLILRYPVVGQMVLMAAISLLWLLYAWQAMRTARRH
jgi:hypothetical protein